MLILRGHEDAVRCLSYSPDGRILASGGEDDTVRLWDLSAGGTLAVSLKHSSSVEALAFAPDSIKALAFVPEDPILIAGTSDGMLFIWELMSRRSRTSIEGHQEGVHFLFYLSDVGDGPMLATAGWDHRVTLWNFPTLQPRPVLDDPPACAVLSWDPMRRTLAIGEANGQIVLFDPDTKSIHRRFGSLLPLSSLGWSPDGRVLASGHTDGTVWLYQMPRIDGSKRLDGHTWTIYALALTPDGRTLISGGADGTVHLWDVASGRERRCYRWHTSWVTCLAVAPDGMTAAAGSADHNIVLWDLDDN